MHCAQPALRTRASALAASLGAHLVERVDEDVALIRVEADGLHLHVPGYASSLHLDAHAPDVLRRAAAGRGSELLRACGVPGAPSPLRVLDATAGLGRDAFVLAAAGAHVDMIERSPVLHALLEDALARAARASSVPPRLGLHAGDAIERLPRVFAAHDLVYLDPMFARDVSALPRREAQLLALFASDAGAAGGQALLETALALPVRRVVVKRARTQAPLLVTPPPHHEIVGRRVRFDVYVRAR